MTETQTLPEELFACPTCFATTPFRKVKGGLQQEVCPEHPVILPDGEAARGAFLQPSDKQGWWLAWSRDPESGHLDIFALEMPLERILLADDAKKD